MTSTTLQSHIQKYLFERSHIYQACNFIGSGYAESDILAVTRSLMVTEIEIKISRSDFKADFKKKHKHYKMQNCKEDGHFKVPNRFYYACPSDMISIEEVPTYAGLVYVSESGVVEIIKPAPLLHKRKAEEKLMFRLLENLTAKTIFGCQYMTYKNREAKEYYNQKIT